MNCKRCKKGPIEYIYRIDWTDYLYCPQCNLEHTVDLRRKTELIDRNQVLEERYGE